MPEFTVNSLQNIKEIFEYLAVSRIIKEHRGGYDKAYVLSETDGNDVTYFLRYVLKCIEEALASFLEYLGRKTDEQKRMGSEFKGMDLNLRQRTILCDVMRSGEPFSVNQIGTEYQVTPQTARADISKLERMGLIRRHGKEWNKQLYVFAEGAEGSSIDKVPKLDRWTQDAVK